MLVPAASAARGLVARIVRRTPGSRFAGRLLAATPPPSTPPASSPATATRFPRLVGGTRFSFRSGGALVASGEGALVDDVDVVVVRRAAIVHRRIVACGGFTGRTADTVIVAPSAVGATLATTAPPTAAPSASPTSAASLARGPLLAGRLITGRVIASGAEALGEALAARRPGADAILAASTVASSTVASTAVAATTIADRTVAATLVAAFPQRRSRSLGRWLGGTGLEAEIRRQV